MGLNIMVAVMAVIAVAALIACWRMDHSSGEDEQEEKTENMSNRERQVDHYDFIVNNKFTVSGISRDTVVGCMDTSKDIFQIK